MSLPRVLSLNPESELAMKVSPAAEQLRGRRTQTNAGADATARQKILDGFRIHDFAAELLLELLPKADAFAIHLQSESGENFATVSCATRSGGRELEVNGNAAPLPGTTGSPMRLHLFLDGSVLELLANGTCSLTKRIYEIPSSPLRLNIQGEVELVSFDGWPIMPISKNRLTGWLCA